MFLDKNNLPYQTELREMVQKPSENDCEWKF